MMNLEEMKSRKGRTKLDEDALELVSGGASTQTAEWLATAKAEKWGQEHFIEFVDYVLAEYGPAVFNDLFGGDTYEEIMNTQKKFFMA